MIAATVDLTMAGRRRWDIAVVGAGPAGALAARELARRGCSVLLLDRASFPRWKVCGCCVNGQAQGVLRAVGLAGMLFDNGAVPLTAIRLYSAGRSADVALSGGVVLSRESFDAALIRAALASGADFLPQTTASLLPPERNTDLRSLILRQGENAARVSARVVLAADGLSGGLATRGGDNSVAALPGGRIGAGVVVADAPAYYERGRIYMACGREGYLGLVRLEDGRLNLAAALEPRFVRSCGGLGHAAARLLADSAWPEIPKLSEQRWQGTPTLTRQARHCGGERLLLLGDAAGYIEPFTGEGIAWALTTAKAVTPLAARGVAQWHPHLVHQWDARYRRLLGPRRFLCRIAAQVLRSPRLTQTLVQLLAFAPALALPFTAYLGERKIRPFSGNVLSSPMPTV